MNLAQRPHSRRGFTLIEMLVVIAIITVLVALVVPAVMYFTRKGPQLLTTNEISQLDTAIQNFKTTYKVDYIPSRLRLCENITDYTLSINSPDPFDTDLVVPFPLDDAQESAATA